MTTPPPVPLNTIPNPPKTGEDYEIDVDWSQVPKGTDEIEIRVEPAWNGQVRGEPSTVKLKRPDKSKPLAFPKATAFLQFHADGFSVRIVEVDRSSA